MRVIQPTDQHTRRNLWTGIYGPPGTGKTTLACTADEPFLLAFDQGWDRAGIRVPTVEFDRWEEAEEFVTGDPGFLACKTVLIDTIGHGVDLAWAACVRANPRIGSVAGGPKGPEGWGALKGRVRGFMSVLKGKDVVFVAHDKEKKGRKLKDEVVGTQPDILGGSYALVMRDCDLIGCVAIEDDRHVIEFAPSATSIGKTLCGWGTLNIPSSMQEIDGKLVPVISDPRFMAKIIQQGKEYLSRQSAAGAETASQVDGIRAELKLAQEKDDLDAMKDRLSKLSGVVKAQAVVLWKARLGELGWAWDVKAGYTEVAK